ncbi:dynein axonemal heavy chain 3-like isoform X3 [Rhodnius prolixus]|uniref:dynein axonemal heavy chain 3-like isoform X3 n=1 Tax=Rhodnius prolixus TaxID=13249 RepID=UPI003D18CC79
MDGISVFDANEYRIERKRKMLPAQPLLPAANKDNTEMVKQMVEVSRFPPLFKENTLTKGLPIKDALNYTTPSSRIGSTYTPGTRDIQLSQVTKRIKTNQNIGREIGMFDSAGELQFPPGFIRGKEDPRYYSKLKAAERNKPGVVDLKDLLTGEYERRKLERKKIASKSKEKKLKEQFKREREVLLEEERKLMSMSAELPRSPDLQRRIQLKKILEEPGNKMRPEDVKTIYHYFTYGISKDIIQPFNEEWLEAFKSHIPDKLLTKWSKLLPPLFKDIRFNYTLGIRKAIIEYLLLDGNERKRLNILYSLPRFPNIVIRSPVPWHNSFVTISHQLHYKYYCSHPVVLAISKLWYDRYKRFLIVPISKLEEAKMPIRPAEFDELTLRLCEEAQETFTNLWLVDVAEIILNMRDTWEYFAPKTPNESTALVEKFFDCINTLLSLQLRYIVLRSINHYRSIIHKYEGGNSILNEYKDLMFPRVPFLTITVIPNKKSSDLTLTPSLSEIKRVIQAVFPKILHLTKKLPAIEKYIFPDLEKNKPFLSSVRSFEEEVVQIIDNTMITVDKNITGPDKYLNSYSKYFYILTGEASLDLDKFFAVDPMPSLKDFAKKIRTYEDIKAEIRCLRGNIPLNLLNLDCTVLNDTMWNIIDSLKKRITDYFLDQSRKLNKEINSTFDVISLRASEMPVTTAELVDFTNFVNESRDSTMFDMRTKLLKSGEYLSFIFDYELLPEDDIQLIAKCFLWPREMDAILDAAMGRINLQRDIVETSLKKRKSKFEETLLEHQKMLEIFRKKDPPILTLEEMATNAEGIERLVVILKGDKTTADALNTEEELLEFEISPFKILHQMLAGVEPYDRLWHTVYDFHTSYDKWFYGPFMGLNAEEIKETVESMWRNLYKLARTFYNVPGSKRVAETVRGKVDKFRQYIPVLEAICNPGLKERHWREISEIVGIDLHPTEETTLAEMIEYDLSRFIPKLEEISVAASREFTLEQNLKKMKFEWQNVAFELIIFRDTGVPVLSAVDDIQVMLDDHILKAQTMRGSPYVKPFEEEMQKWEEKLLSMQDILDAWFQVQVTWMYLEAIFSSEDIMRQMPEEGKAFQKVDASWRQLMESTNKDPNVLLATDYPNLLKVLRELNGLLEVIQKGLNEYLEKKRLYFPRFFFLSNDNLLEILSETKDPLRVQPHLKNCFEGIASLDFNDEVVIVGMISAEDEIVPFVTNIVPAEAKGLVEKWLVQVEQVMRESLKDICSEALNTYGTMYRVEWLLSWPGMIAICCNFIKWTAEVTEALSKGKVQEYYETCNVRVIDLVRIIRGNIAAGARITMEALIILEVHARDIVKLLVDLKTRTVDDFNWISQLRYYYEDDIVHVRMITTDFEYGYEYLGNTTRLTVTPLTDRCYRTLMSALKLNLGGAPEGPAGTGKTETCKDLAKAVAKQCVVFNCSDSLDYKSMGKFFKGLAQSGAWSCFDEFNRIELEVLSVIAQQVLCIQLAIIQSKKVFIFEGTEISLNPTCNVFITMNPGYAGRQELPDNLKVLFRTVAMMVPDYAMIGETELYSKGFDSARILAAKIVETYKLCSEQLSSQSHYDYGMRAVKTVLKAAGLLKQKYPFQSEYVIVLRAIIDVNEPKFLGQDLPLFSGIYQDLFPGIVLPAPDRVELIETLKIKLRDHNLQPTDWYINKIIQIYEMILVRHGLMIVGESMGGKTCGYQNLGEALSQIQNNKKSSMEEFKVQYRIVNPKSITMGQLYGQFDAISHEWSDGVLANTFREFATSPSLDRKWILFDGPVDAVWIENMNTVLDDNKKLCLMSGEIIQMTNKMNMVFEPADLEFASPATVSRCGMIYLEPKLLGWKALYASYCNILVTKLNAEQYELAKEMIEWLIPPVVNFIAIKAKMFVDTSELHLFYSFSRFFTCMLDHDKQPGGLGTFSLQCLVIFCILWGIGSPMKGESRIKFDTFYRSLTAGSFEEYPKPSSFKVSKHQLFPDKGTVWDWFFDKKGNGSWMPWLETVDKVPIPHNAKVSDLIIQTDDTAKQRFFIKLFLNALIPILFVGPTGTGKSSIILNYLMSLPRDKYMPNVINFSARTSANQTQEIIMSKLDRRRKGVYGPTMGKMCLLFVDDLSMPQKEVYGAQPPIELLRQLIDHKHWYDLKTTARLDLVDILFVSAMVPPGGGSNVVTARLLRHMNVIGIDSFQDLTLTKIFTSILDWHFSKGFDERISRLSKLLVAGTLEVYTLAVKTFLPTPAKSHYTFNLRDFSRVIRGLLLVPSSRIQAPEKMFRLWVHESIRVFGDRLIEDSDRSTLFEIMKEACYFHIRAKMSQFLSDLVPEKEELNTEHVRNLFFGNYFEPDADPKVYDEILDLDKLEDVMNYYLQEYNLLSKVPMSLVMFKFAIEHVSRISRVLQQDNGHVMLVGIGGSGRQSCTRLATHMSEYVLFQIEIGRNYDFNEWRDDIRKLLKQTGIDAKPHVFLFADSQIKDEAFVEDINMLLNTGDVPNLYQTEEKAEILEKMTNAARESGKKIESTPLALYNYFIERVKACLHVALAMSPIGDSFRNRIRMFPSLVNCCTIDWFTSWPVDALEKVAQFYIEQIDIADVVKEKCVKMCQAFHTSVGDASQRYFELLKRKNYVTPTSYLELIMTFQNLHQKKVDQVTLLRTRYEVGLEKLDFAASQVAVMQDELHALQPQLVKTSEETEKLMVKIEQDTVIVEAKKEIVAADEALANEAAAAAQAIKDDCESDLAEAIPALEAAIAALNTLKPADITIVKSMKNPPAGVKLVMEAVCVMKGIKPERKPDPSGSGKMIEDYWGPSQKMLGDMKFLDSLKGYDKDNINPAIMKRIREKFIPDRDFDPNVIKTVSNACEGLCKWVRAMEVYDRVNKIVAPKKAKYEEAEAELSIQMGKLNEKRAQLKKVTDNLQALNDEYTAKSKAKKDLEDAITLCTQKLERAEKLIGGLGGEKKRWSETAETLKFTLINAIGDVLLSSGVVAYLGAFTVTFRTELIQEWNQLCKELEIPCSSQFSMIVTLGDPVKIRAWNIFGLPKDNFSVENGIIVHSARRWSLMIDPQGQANKWIKSMEKDNHLSVIKLTDANYMRKVEVCIEHGLPVLLENILEGIDASLEPVLLKNFYHQGGMSYLKVGDSLLQYHPNFRFYITTRLRNPHYLPEIAVKVTLINFMITPQGLEDQLLGIVVAEEKPDLEEKKNALIIESAENKKQLKELEDEILRVLSQAEGNILENETAIQTLSQSKILSETILKKQEVAATTEFEIDHARNHYIPVSKHSSVLFFCISDLANVDPMYQYSLVWFINLYFQAIKLSEKSDNLEKRIFNLNEFFTLSIYRNVCRSLFEKDKLTFSFVLCIGIERSKGLINEELFAFFLTGGVALENLYPNPSPEWLGDKSWAEVVRASALPGMEKFKTSVEKNNSQWKRFYDAFDPVSISPPEPFTNIRNLIWLVILRCIRSDKVVPAAQQYIVDRMSKLYVEPPPFNLLESYNDSNCCSPLVFILSPGSDPMASLLKFADDMNISRTSLLTISLGQGQGPVAARMIDSAIVSGQWVILQNCHLAVSWMEQLDKICDEVVVPAKTHTKFRIWLTSYPSEAFPVSILQNGVKMTNEPPKGLKANLYRSYLMDPISDPRFFQGCSVVNSWQKLLFSLCFFHAVVQERRKFGPLGWNILYEFNESDLKISVSQLQMFISDYDEVPFDALLYLTGECNYGGRVTDDKDRRLLNSILSIYYNNQVVTEDNYAFSPSGTYYIPDKTDYDGILKYIETLPFIPHPEVFGLHENADITKNNKETNELLGSILKTQAEITAGAGIGDTEEMISELSADILNKLPPEFNVLEIEKKYPTVYSQSMNTVLRQELIRYNRLIAVIVKSLKEVVKAVKGLVLMSAALEEVNYSMLVGKVPNMWASKSYPSLKPLGSYINDLILRLNFFNTWIEEGIPNVFWLPGFYFTQSFLSGVLQNFSRKWKISIDQLGFEFTVTQFDNNASSAPQIGVFCSEKCSYNPETFITKLNRMLSFMG